MSSVVSCVPPQTGSHTLPIPTGISPLPSTPPASDQGGPQNSPTLHHLTFTLYFSLRQLLRVLAVEVVIRMLEEGLVDLRNCFGKGSSPHLERQHSRRKMSLGLFRQSALVSLLICLHPHALARRLITLVALAGRLFTFSQRVPVVSNRLKSASPEALGMLDFRIGSAEVVSG